LRDKKKEKAKQKKDEAEQVQSQIVEETKDLLENLKL